MSDSIQSKIKKRLEKLLPGQIVVISDFSDIAEAKTVSKTLTRLEGFKNLSRLGRGIFWKKREDCDMPEADEYAHAIARSNGWHIAAAEDTALYFMGFSEKIPKEWTYVSDGSPRQYPFGDTFINFKHTASRYVTSFSEQTACLVQALKYIGQSNINAEHIDKLKNKLKHFDIKKLLHECRKSPAWICALILTVCSLQTPLIK